MWIFLRGPRRTKCQRIGGSRGKLRFNLVCIFPQGGLRDMKRFCSTLALAILTLSLSAPRLHAGESAALTGVVTSDAEGPMEGVLVSAKRLPGTITVTVVSDQSGTYGFPAGRLAPGKYRLAIRAIGYDLADPEMTVAVG